MKNTTLLGTLAATTVLLSACATRPPEALVEARTTVRAAQSDPSVQANAPQELQRATESLNRANTLAGNRESKAEVASVAYVAAQQARAAMTVAKAKEQEKAVAAGQLERERTRADARTVEAQQAQAQANTAMNQAAQAQASVATTSEENARLQQQLANLQAKQTERGMVVTLGDVLFETGKADVKPNAQSELHKLADFLHQYPNRRVLIEGHTDSVGAAASNEALSQRRADSVEKALVRMGADAGHIDTIGYGEEFPVSGNDNASDRAMNRRVEVYISDTNAPVRGRR